MESKKKILYKILEIYLGIFYIFAQIAVVYLLSNIFVHFGIVNNFVNFITIVITILSFIGLLNAEDIIKDDKK